MRTLPLICVFALALTLDCTRASDTKVVRKVWATRLRVVGGGAGIDAFLDAAGNVFVLGFTRGYVLVKHSTDGSVQWKRPVSHRSVGVGRDGKSFVFLGYDYVGGLSVACLSPRNEVLWRQRLPFAATSLAVDRYGNVVVTGERTSKFAGHDGHTLWERRNPFDIAFASIKADARGDFVLSGGGTGFFIAKSAGETGEWLWSTSQQFVPRDPYYDPGPGNFVLDPQGNVAIYGYYFIDYRHVYGYAGWLASENGDLAWEKKELPLAPSAAAMDSAGNVILIGGSALVAKYSAGNGAELWSHGVADYRHSGQVAVDANDDIIVAKGVYEYRTVKYAGSDGAVVWQQVHPRREGYGTGTFGLGVGPGIIAVTGQLNSDYGTIKYAEGSTPHTLPVAYVRSSSAQLLAEVNPNLFSAEAGFLYGTEPNLRHASTSEFVTIGRGRKAVKVEATITQLQPGTQYYYCAVGRAKGGLTTRGEVRAFQTALED